MLFYHLKHLRVDWILIDKCKGDCFDELKVGRNAVKLII